MDQVKDTSVQDLTTQNTLALKSCAHDYHEFTDREALSTYLYTLSSELPLLVLGGGSNLILPEVVTTPVIKLGFDQLEFAEEGDAVIVRAGAAIEWDKLVAEAVARGYAGIENLSLIPGSVGAAPVQNIGAYGVELVDVLLSIEAYDRKEKQYVTLTPDQCDFAYRDSIFKQKVGRYIITEVVLELSTQLDLKLHYGELKALLNDPANAGARNNGVSLQAVRDHVIKVRRAKLPDPDTIPNVGSFFKNPIVPESVYKSLKEQYPKLVAYPQENKEFKLAAGWLIDQAGWKGRVMGNAAVHDRQALVLVNKGKATQQDILALASAIQDDIQLIYGIALEIEPVRLFC
jgi:UDP-N-acetylmuramate dehydrogenase